MLYFFGKLLQVLLSPLSLALLLLGVSLGLSWHARKKTPWRLAAAAFLILFIPSLPLVGNGLLSSLENQFPFMTEKQAPNADAILVLGGTALSQDDPTFSVEEDGSRLVPASRLYKEGKAKWIVVSGGAFYKRTSGEIRGETQDMHDFLVGEGVPSSAILVENRSRNTNEHGLYTRSILDERKINTVLLVTNAYHMPRSVAMMHKHGIKNIIPFPTMRRSRPFQFHWFDLFPSLGALGSSVSSLKEYFGRWAYQYRA